MWEKRNIHTSISMYLYHLVIYLSISISRLTNNAALAQPLPVSPSQPGLLIYFDIYCKLIEQMFYWMSHVLAVITRTSVSSTSVPGQTWTNGRTNEWTDGRTDGRSIEPESTSYICLLKSTVLSADCLWGKKWLWFGVHTQTGGINSSFIHKVNCATCFHAACHSLYFAPHILQRPVLGFSF
mgnify:FL=1